MDRVAVAWPGQKRMAWLTALDHYTWRARSWEGLAFMLQGCHPSRLLARRLLSPHFTPDRRTISKLSFNEPALLATQGAIGH